MEERTLFNFDEVDEVSIKAAQEKKKKAFTYKLNTYFDDNENLKKFLMDFKYKNTSIEDNLKNSLIDWLYQVSMPYKNSIYLMTPVKNEELPKVQNYEEFITAWLPIAKARQEAEHTRFEKEKSEWIANCSDWNITSPIELFKDCQKLESLYADMLIRKSVIEERIAIKTGKYQKKNPNDNGIWADSKFKDIPDTKIELQRESLQRQLNEGYQIIANKYDIPFSTAEFFFVTAFGFYTDSFEHEDNVYILEYNELLNIKKEVDSKSKKGSKIQSFFDTSIKHIIDYQESKNEENIEGLFEVNGSRPYYQDKTGKAILYNSTLVTEYRRSDFYNEDNTFKEGLTDEMKERAANIEAYLTYRKQYQEKSAELSVIDEDSFEYARLQHEVTDLLEKMKKCECVFNINDKKIYYSLNDEVKILDSGTDEAYFYNPDNKKILYMMTRYVSPEIIQNFFIFSQSFRENRSKESLSRTDILTSQGYITKQERSNFKARMTEEERIAYQQSYEASVTSGTIDTSKLSQEEVYRKQFESKDKKPFFTPLEDMKEIPDFFDTPLIPFKPTELTDSNGIFNLKYADRIKGKYSAYIKALWELIETNHNPVNPFLVSSRDIFSTLGDYHRTARYYYIQALNSSNPSKIRYSREIDRLEMLLDNLVKWNILHSYYYFKNDKRMKSAPTKEAIFKYDWSIFFITEDDFKEYGTNIPEDVFKIYNKKMVEAEKKKERQKEYAKSKATK